MRLLIRVVINAVALYVASLLVDINITNNVVGILVVALIFGAVNALIKPIISILTCPITVLTLGLFTLVINALMLMLTAWVSGGLMQVNGFWTALLGSLIISVVSFALSLFLTDDSR